MLMKSVNDDNEIEFDEFLALMSQSPSYQVIFNSKFITVQQFSIPTA